ncbi:hypothetical protein ACQPWR_10020 [Micromonospora vinacea]|uniref:hypothetical protein n=1 Tax=Micromonospora vinacea TaxID=709878 RepID=UPI003D90D4E5
MPIVEQEGITMIEQCRPEPPFLVIMAGYVIDLHHRDVCGRCRPDGTCPKLAEAAERLTTWRERRR